MSYIHKSGAQKRQEKRVRDGESMEGLQTLFQVGIHRPAENLSKLIEGVLDEIIVDAVDIVENKEVSEYNSEVIAICEFEETQVRIYDIGALHEHVSKKEIEEWVNAGPQPKPLYIPPDVTGQAFPFSLFMKRRPNGESENRDWLVYSQCKNALFCFPCRLFAYTEPCNRSTPSYLASINGCGPSSKWKRLFDRIPHHENSTNHKRCYLEWRQLEIRLLHNSTIDMQLNANITTEISKWKELLQRIIDVVLFLGERGLSFRGDTHVIGDVHNGNFLGIIELISHYDPVLREHVTKVQESQKEGKRLQAHYLSKDSQNEFIHICADKVRRCILEERNNAKYFSIMVDATPDVSHIEQNTFVLRYLTREQDKYIIRERFFTFVDDSGKTGSEIATMILSFLTENEIPFKDCRGQGYDNASNMSGRYNGVQNILKQENPLCTFSPCGCHSLNLCGAKSALCCRDAITFFGTIQTIYSIFSSSPKRWAILVRNIGVSLHGQSHTRWTERIDSVRPFTTHLPGINLSLNELLELNLTAKAKTEIFGAINYVSSYKCVLMSAIWYKVLKAIDERNRVIEARDATIDIEVRNLDDLLDELKTLKENWPSILEEVNIVAKAQNIEPPLPVRQKKRKQFFDDNTVERNKEIANEAGYQATFNQIIDCVLEGLTTRYRAIYQINQLFGFLWNYLDIGEENIINQCNDLETHYDTDISGKELQVEVLHLKTIHHANLSDHSLDPLKLLNTIRKNKLEGIFPNLCISLRIFLTLPVTIASAERSFSKLKLIKNYLRSTMLQERLSDLTILSIESELARTVDFSQVIDSFASIKARRGFC